MSGKHGLLQPNRPGYYYVTLEESYVALFRISAEKWFKANKGTENADKNRNARLAHAVAKAYIIDVLVNLSNDLYKITGSERDLWVFLSFPHLESRLHGGVKMRTLKDAMKELIDDGYVFKQPNRDPRYKSLEYRLNLSKLRKELEALPTKTDRNVSADLHDGIDGAILHDVRANLHDDSADLHDDSANLHAIRKKDLTNTKKREKEGTASVPPIEPDSPSIPSFSPSSSQEKDPEEERTRDYWQQLGYIEKAGSQKHWKTLAEYTKTFEQFKSLFEFTRDKLEGDPKITNKEVSPGNMVKQFTGWKQEQERKKRLAEPVKITRSKEDPLAKMKEIGSRYINQGVN